MIEVRDGIFEVVGPQRFTHQELDKGMGMFDIQADTENVTDGLSSCLIYLFKIPTFKIPFGFLVPLKEERIA